MIINQKPPTLDGPIHPNCGVRISYTEKLEAAIDAMTKAAMREIKTAYAVQEARFAIDASPAAELQKLMRRFSNEWQRRFNNLAPELAAYFTQKAADRVDAQLAGMLRRAGFTVRWRATAEQVSARAAIVAENVSLIRSIPQQYMTQVEGDVMRSVAAGRHLPSLIADLQHRAGVTRRRAVLIARDQNNKATAMLSRVRELEAGITAGIWNHSHAGNEPRPSHVAYSGETYDIAKGALIDGKRIWPGTEIECKCLGTPCLPGWTP